MAEQATKIIGLRHRLIALYEMRQEIERKIAQCENEASALLEELVLTLEQLAHQRPEK